MIDRLFQMLSSSLDMYIERKHTAPEAKKKTKDQQKDFKTARAKDRGIQMSS